ncbi:MAG: hypothetical protein SFY67_10530 [Candidatus Melainabacteria bacterium]|nr:hypothetical protein [Candidatus Melainabacteria bacterium]
METEKKQELFLVSEHPEVFGPLTDAFQAINRDKLIQKAKLALNCLIVFLLLLAAPVAYRVYVELQAPQAANGEVWMDTIKIIALYICIALTLLLIGLGMYYFRLKHLLMQMEENAELGRDMARVMFPYYRQELQEIKHKIKGATAVNQEDAQGFATIVKSLMPVAQMLLKKDASILNWGMQGLKLYKTFSGFFKK